MRPSGRQLGSAENSGQTGRVKRTWSLNPQDWALGMSKDAESHAAEAILDLYERKADAWIRLRQAFVERRWIERFAACLPAHGAVLDLGCGAGAPGAHFLADGGFCLTGVDGAPSLVAEARRRLPHATWIVSDIRGLALSRRFDGIVAWHSLFHLTPDDQRAMFPIFAAHAAPGAHLLFTSGDSESVVIGDFDGEPLYHASLEPDEYRACLSASGFEVVAHVAGDPDCGDATVWLARFRSQAPCSV